MPAAILDETIVAGMVVLLHADLWCGIPSHLPITRAQDFLRTGL
jgi:hypothetical protein